MSQADTVEQLLDEHFAGRDESRRIFDTLRAKIEAYGEVEIRVSKSQVALARRRNVAVAWTPGRYLEEKLSAPLVLTISLHRHDDSARWKEIVATGDGRYTHHLELRAPEEIDDDVLAWLAEAWGEAG
jgi:sulfite reductase beta subunit-like hemoprotein